MISSAVYKEFACVGERKLERVKEEVIKVCEVRMIYLLGEIVVHRKTRSIFIEKEILCASTGEYFLLVLVDKDGGVMLSSVQDKIESRLRHFIPCTVFALFIDDYLQWLSDGHPFANTVYERGRLIYSNYELDIPYPKVVDEEEVKKKNELLHQQTGMKVESFLAGAELYRVRKEYRMAVFMLHQAAEQVLRSMLVMKTGLRVVSHNIEKMLRYCGLFDSELAQVFDKRGEKDRRLLKVLNDAYLDARYKEEGYTVNGEDVELMMDKVQYTKQVFARHYPTKLITT